MNRKAHYLIIMAVLAIMLALSGCSGSADSGAMGGPGGIEPLSPANTVGAVNAYSHNNNVYFSLQNFSSNVSITFSETGHDITSGQPWDGVTGSYDSNGTFTITVKCGRKNSGGPLGWFEEQIGTGLAISADGSPWNPHGQPAPSPTAMNFALTGVLSINGNAYPICLGQSGESLHNVWYMGGSEFRYNMITPDGKYSFEDSGSDDEFMLTELSN